MSDLRCKEFVELVTAFLDDALDAGTELRFVDHLKYCEGCDHYFHQIRTTISLLGSLLAPGSLPDGA
jgi:hypothetical protein